MVFPCVFLFLFFQLCFVGHMELVFGFDVSYIFLLSESRNKRRGEDFKFSFFLLFGSLGRKDISSSNNRNKLILLAVAYCNYCVFFCS